MSRLDRHVAFVQSKLALGKFFSALTFTIMVWLAAIWVAMVFDHLAQVRLPRQFTFLWASAAAAVIAAFIYSLVRKPTAHDAAVAIDVALGLNEKFSTALFIRNSKDPFAMASVKDAERAADNVSLHRRFPLVFPRRGYWTIGAAVAVLLTAFMLPTVDLFGREAKRKSMVAEQQKRDEAKKSVERALATVSSYPKSLQSTEAIQMAKKDLEGLLNQPMADVDSTKRTAFKALKQSNEALKEEIRKNDQYAMAKSNEKMLKALSPPADEQGPVADAQRDLAKGELSKAVDQLNQVASKFDKMSDTEQKKAADQMAKLAQQLQQMAQNPAAQQQLQKQLQQMGASQKMAREMAKQMQQAAQGNPQAQQQLQQMQQQMMQQAQAQGMSKQAQQQMQKAMQQMQAQANSQASAQQMQQAAQQMAQAMKQSASQKGGQQGGMAKAQQQMQQAIGQMDAVQKDAEEMNAAQQNTQDAQNSAGDQAGDKTGDGKDGKQQGYSDSTGKWQPGDTNKQGKGAGGPGKGNGGHVGMEQAPYAIKKETAPVQDIDSGKILASTFVKAGTVKGDAKVALSKAAESAMKDSTDEVDEESVSKDSEKFVKHYFETMQQGE